MALGMIATFVVLWKKLPSGNQHRGILLAYACLGTAIVFEIIEGPIDDAEIRWRGHLLTSYLKVIEEFLELCGPAILLSLLIEMLERKLIAHGPNTMPDTVRPATSKQHDSRH
jgi:hypothetical protein